MKSISVREMASLQGGQGEEAATLVAVYCGIGTAVLVSASAVPSGGTSLGAAPAIAGACTSFAGAAAGILSLAE